MRRLKGRRQEKGKGYSLFVIRKSLSVGQSISQSAKGRTPQPCPEPVEQIAEGAAPKSNPSVLRTVSPQKSLNTSLQMTPRIFEVKPLRGEPGSQDSLRFLFTSGEKSTGTLLPVDRKDFSPELSTLSFSLVSCLLSPISCPLSTFPFPLYPFPCFSLFTFSCPFSAFLASPLSMWGFWVAKWALEC
jgi:hypothetical protein